MDTLGVVESRHIASGALLADLMVKAASVELLRASPICSGRFLIFVTGERDAVQTAVHEARLSGRPLHGSFVISGISPQVMAALRGQTGHREGDALGLVECRSAAAGVMSADAAVKRAQVRLERLTLAQGINGKAYFVLGGEVSAVEEAVRAAEEALGASLLDSIVIPRPEGAVVRALVRPAGAGEIRGSRE